MGLPLRSPAPDSFLDPLAFLQAEHARQLEIVDRLLALASQHRIESVAVLAEDLIAFLVEDLPLHHKDEEQDLFHLLRSHGSKEEGIEDVLAELDRDHATEKFLVLSIVMDLRRISGGRLPENPSRLFMEFRLFAEGQKRHLAWENNVVLPLAHKILSPNELKQIGRNMAVRRGMSYPD